MKRHSLLSALRAELPMLIRSLASRGKFFTLLFIFLLFFNAKSSAQMGKWTELHPTIKGNYPNNVFPNRWQFGMAQLTNKKVLLFGGSVDDTIQLPGVNDTWIYDLDENTWTQINTKNTPLPRVSMGMAQITNGKILMCGGVYRYDDSLLSDTWIFDIVDSNWHYVDIQTDNKKSRPGKIAYHGMAKLSEGKILLFGGDHYGTDDTFIFDIDSLDWHVVDDLKIKPKGRILFGISQMSPGEILLYGGVCGYTAQNDKWMFKEKDYQWELLNNDNQIWKKAQNPISMLTKDYLFMFGGGDYDMEPDQNDSWIFDIKNKVWIKENPKINPDGRNWHNMATITYGKVLMCGDRYERDGYDWPNDTWIYELDSAYMSIEEKKAEASLRWTLSDNQLMLFLPDQMDPQGIKKISIYDILGQEIPAVKDYRVQGNTITVDLELALMNSGLYFAIIDCGTERLALKFAKE